MGLIFWPRPRKIIDYELDGPLTSQQPLDIYSLSHYSHGVIFFLLLGLFIKSKTHIIVLGLILEVFWEWIENTSFIIDKYRSNSRYKTYHGDSLINIFGDILFALIGLVSTAYYPVASIYIALMLELLLIPFDASLLSLSLGSLL